MAVTPAALPDSIETVSIVLLGLFQIDEFEPSNLLRLESIEARELEVGKIKLRLPDAYVIQYPSLHVTAERNKVQLTSTPEEPVFERVKEFFLAFFTTSKGHSASALGINFDFHRRISETEIWHTIGHRLVPKDAWRTALKLQEPGLMSVVVEGKRDDGEAGSVRVRVEPSGVLQPGVYLQINDHFDLKTEAGLDDALRIVNARWRDCRKRHLEISSSVTVLR
jgi:hypothetical protein